jgi:transposase
LALVDSGVGVYAVSALLLVSASWIYKAVARRRSTGETTARPQRNQVRPKLADLHDAIRDEVSARPDVTLSELRAWLREEHGASVSLSVLWHDACPARLAAQKNTLHAAEQEPPDVAAARANRRADQRNLNAAKLS